MAYILVPNTISSPHHPSNSPECYTAQSMIRDSKEDIELKAVSALRAQRSDHLHPAHVYVSDHKTHSVHLAHEPESIQSTACGRLSKIMRNVWLTGFMPVIALAYISVCYAAATQVVPVRIWMVDQPADHLFAIKAGVTTVNIIAIGLSLLPLKSLIDELKGEEFFRMLRTSQTGVPFKAINSVSTPSHTYGRVLRSIIRNHASKYYTGAVLTALMGTLISSLAPAALSVGVISVDKELTAFRVGAVASDSVVKVYLTSVKTNPKFDARAAEAASMGWVQSVLGMGMYFQATSPKYGVPVPLDLQPTDRARYVTDVAVMDPTCTWTVPNPPVVPVANASDSYPKVNITLPDFGVSTQEYADQFIYRDAGPQILLKVLGNGVGFPLVNISTGDPPITGVMGWLMVRCKSCPPPAVDSSYSTINMSGIPTQEYHGVRRTAVENVTEPVTTEFSILMCDPRLSVETREVRLDGSGKITVMEGSGLTRQGNLHLTQTRLLVGQALTKFSSDSGPEIAIYGIGKAAQFQMFFDAIDNSTLTPVLTPRPVEELTQGYMVVQQAAMRSYLSGRMASSFVPGRMQEMTLVFTSSLPHVIVSTILFTCAAIFVNICYLRPNTEQFTLFSVAAALAHSNVGSICEDVKHADGEQGALAGDEALKSLKDRKILLVNGGGPGYSLHME
ncbi:hypothetical protein FRC11_004439 [Ceratobasidium sp. 423]|nr:hypothetical protein FRC11_004439 [Ceratobasidium sp. 423]